MDDKSTQFDEMVRKARVDLALEPAISDDLPETPHAPWRNWLRLLLPSIGMIAESYRDDSYQLGGVLVCMAIAGITVGVVNFLTKPSRAQRIQGGCLAIGWLLAVATMYALVSP